MFCTPLLHSNHLLLYEGCKRSTEAVFTEAFYQDSICTKVFCWHWIYIEVFCWSTFCTEVFYWDSVCTEVFRWGVFCKEVFYWDGVRKEVFYWGGICTEAFFWSDGCTEVLYWGVVYPEVYYWDGVFTDVFYWSGVCTEVFHWEMPAQSAVRHQLASASHSLGVGWRVGPGKSSLTCVLLITCINDAEVVVSQTPEGRPGMSDVSPLSGISGLSFDSTLLSPLLFFCLVLLPFLSYRFLLAGTFV